MQLRRDVLPAIESKGVKLFAVGIGSAEAAAEFAEATDFPATMLLADESELTSAYAAVGARNTGRDEKGKQIFEGVESMWNRDTNAGLKARGRDDLNAVVGSLFKKGIYKPLMPTGASTQRAMEKTFVQGGTFVFDGSRELFTHFDSASGAHADLDEVIRVATSRR